MFGIPSKTNCLIILGGIILAGGWLLPVPARTAPLEELRQGLYDRYGLEINGFIEARDGWRIDREHDEKDASIAEARMQLDMSKDLGWGVARLKTDFVGDAVEEVVATDLREANLLFSPASWVDLKAGRQILTWGTGDLLFINDLFPKDWESFFIGRDDEYLKAPSDAVKASIFFKAFNLDLVYTPQFNESQYIDGSRLSYWNSLTGTIAGRDYVFDDDERLRVFRDSELAARASKNWGSSEFALYAYNGFWKTPEGVKVQPAPKLYYPRLAEYGASFRSPLLDGIASLEAGYYDSREDSDGTDPFIRNSEIRFLAGYEQELGREFTGGVQYYLEWMQDHDDYLRTLPAGTPAKDEYRHVFTLRLTKLLLNQNLRLSLFCYYSPSDQDAYLRPKVNYKVTDRWAVETGANLFYGSEDHTFFGQFKDNNNIYASLRYSF